MINRRAGRPPTSTLEFLLRTDRSAARLPTFEPAVEVSDVTPRVSAAAAALVIAGLLVVGLLLIRLAF